MVFGWVGLENDALLRLTHPTLDNLGFLGVLWMRLFRSNV